MWLKALKMLVKGTFEIFLSHTWCRQLCWCVKGLLFSDIRHHKIVKLQPHFDGTCFPHFRFTLLIHNTKIPSALPRWIAFSSVIKHKDLAPAPLQGFKAAQQALSLMFLQLIFLSGWTLSITCINGAKTHSKVKKVCQLLQADASWGNLDHILLG